MIFKRMFIVIVIVSLLIFLVMSLIPSKDIVLKPLNNKISFITTCNENTGIKEYSFTFSNGENNLIDIKRLEKFDGNIDGGYKTVKGIEINGDLKNSDTFKMIENKELIKEIITNLKDFVNVVR